jgi:hypothetical protein
MNPPPTTRWGAVLDELEARVDAAMALLGDGAGSPPPLAGWMPPEDLGELPAALRPRALQVLAAHAEVEEGLARRMEAIAKDLARTARRPPAFVGAAPRSRFVDHRA